MRLAVLLAASLACVGIGFAKSAALSAHVKDLETLQKIIQYLRGEIVTAASPLPDAFWETGRRMRDPYRDFLQDISEDMRRPDGKTLPAILEENTAVHLADTRLTKEEKEELQEAGCSLGTGDRAMQKANLDRYEARLVQRIAELQKGLPERKRLCQSLGIMGGLFLFLILVLGVSVNGGADVEVGILFKIGAVGILVSVLCQVLKHSGREEQAFLASLAGLVLVLFWILPYISALFEDIKQLFTI